MAEAKHYAVTWDEGRADWPLAGWGVHVVDKAHPEVTVCGLRVPPDSKSAHYRGICPRCEDVVPWRA